MELDRPLEFRDGARNLAGLHVDAPEVQMREVPRLVALSQYGALEPGDRCLEIALLDEVRPDVIVRISKIRIGQNGQMALRNRARDVSLRAERPAQKRVRLCRFGNRERL